MSWTTKVRAKLISAGVHGELLEAEAWADHSEPRPPMPTWLTPFVVTTGERQP